MSNPIPYFKEPDGELISNRNLPKPLTKKIITIRSTERGDDFYEEITPEVLKDKVSYIDTPYNILYEFYYDGDIHYSSSVDLRAGFGTKECPFGKGDLIKFLCCIARVVDLQEDNNAILLHIRGNIDIDWDECDAGIDWSDYYSIVYADYPTVIITGWETEDGKMEPAVFKDKWLYCEPYKRPLWDLVFYNMVFDITITKTQYISTQPSDGGRAEAAWFMSGFNGIAIFNNCTFNIQNTVFFEFIKEGFHSSAIECQFHKCTINQVGKCEKLRFFSEDFHDGRILMSNGIIRSSNTVTPRKAGLIVNSNVDVNGGIACDYIHNSTVTVTGIDTLSQYYWDAHSIGATLYGCKCSAYADFSGLKRPPYADVGYGQVSCAHDSEITCKIIGGGDGMWDFALVCRPVHEAWDCNIHVTVLDVVAQRLTAAAVWRAYGDCNVVFDGSVRTGLDPSNDYSNQQYATFYIDVTPVSVCGSTTKLTTTLDVDCTLAPRPEIQPGVDILVQRSIDKYDCDGDIYSFVESAYYDDGVLVKVEVNEK